MLDIRLVYVTAADADAAAAIGTVLVEERLVACANVLDGIRSIYRWEGKTCDDSEALLLMKTPSKNVDAVIERAKELHDYDCPCIVSLPVESGNPDFLNWVAAECNAL